MLSRTDGQRLKQLRRACGLTQEELAAQADVSHYALVKMESGYGRYYVEPFYRAMAVLEAPRYRNLCRILNALPLLTDDRLAYLASLMETTDE